MQHKIYTLVLSSTRITISFFFLFVVKSSLLAFTTIPNVGENPITNKVLIIGIDGCRPDALAAANTPNLDQLMANGTFTYNARTIPPTWSGPGWSSMLTGVWYTKHGVSDNTFFGSNYEEYPHFFNRIETFNPSLYTASIVHWGPINNTIMDQADFQQTFDSDVAVSNSAVNLLQTGNPDILFLHYDDVDHAGHADGFSTTVPSYIAAIEGVDTNLGPVLTALNNRSTIANENWIIMVSTDHGGSGTGHGGSSEVEKEIFLIVSGDQVPNQEITKTTIETNPSVANLSFDGSNDYAFITENNVFDFGASQDFSIECRVKTSGWSGDPAIVSDKNWNSGIYNGFVLAGKTDGAYWKVNVGDGFNRIDLDGGIINDNQWHHLTLTCDRDGEARVYQDGILMDAVNMSNVDGIDSDYPIGIGQDGTLTYGDFFSGMIDEVRIWNKALDATSIREWACESVTENHPFYPNLVGYWQMNEGSSSSTADSSPTNVYASIVGATWNTPTEGVNCFEHHLPEIVDITFTALEHLCVPIDPAWGLDGAPFGILACGACEVVGTPCNDNDPNTENDMEDGFCNCAGTPLCNTPLAVSTTIISGNVVKIDWDAVPFAEKYRVRYREQGTNTWIEVNAVVDERFLNGLVPNTSYQYSVKSLCSLDNSIWSATSIFTTSSELCDYPLSASITSITATSAAVSWTTLPDDIKYKIKYKVKNGDWIEIILNPSNYAITALQANEEYRVKLKTKCPLGWTNWSPRYDFTTASSVFFANNEISDHSTYRSSLTIYPNPSRDQINLEWHNINATNLYIIDFLGNTEMEIDATNFGDSIDVSSLSEGLYFVLIKDINGGSFVKKFHVIK